MRRDGAREVKRATFKSKMLHKLLKLFPLN